MRLAKTRADLLALLRGIDDQIAAHEVRALFPPANCSEPALYVQLEEKALAALRAHRVEVLECVASCGEQMPLRFAEDAQLQLV